MSDGIITFCHDCHSGDNFRAYSHSIVRCSVDIYE